MTSRHHGGTEISFRLSGQQCADLIRMMQAAGKHRNGLSVFARSILLHVIADDQAAHEAPTPSPVQGEPYSWDDVKAAPVVRTIVNGVERARGQS